MNTNSITETSLIWPSAHRIMPDGISVNLSIYGDNGSHATGSKIISCNDDNFEFWKWIFSNSKVLPPIVDVSMVENMALTWHDFSPLQTPADGIYVLKSPGQQIESIFRYIKQSLKEKGLLRYLNEWDIDDQISHFWKALKMMSIDCCYIFYEGRCVGSYDLRAYDQTSHNAKADQKFQLLLQSHIDEDIALFHQNNPE